MLVTLYFTIMIVLLFASHLHIVRLQLRSVATTVFKVDDHDMAMMLGYRGLDFSQLSWQIQNTGAGDMISVSIIHTILEHEYDKEELLKAMVDLGVPLDTPGRVRKYFFLYLSLSAIEIK